MHVLFITSLLSIVVCARQHDRISHAMPTYVLPVLRDQPAETTFHAINLLLALADTTAAPSWLSIRQSVPGTMAEAFEASINDHKFMSCCSCMRLSSPVRNMKQKPSGLETSKYTNCLMS